MNKNKQTEGKKTNKTEIKKKKQTRYQKREKPEQNDFNFWFRSTQLLLWFDFFCVPFFIF